MRQAQFTEFTAALAAQPHRAVFEQAPCNTQARGVFGDIGHLAGQRLRPCAAQRATDRRTQQAQADMAQFRQWPVLH